MRLLLLSSDHFSPLESEKCNFFFNFFNLTAPHFTSSFSHLKLHSPSYKTWVKTVSYPGSVTQNEERASVFPGSCSASGSFAVVQTPLATRAMSSRGKVDKREPEQQCGSQLHSILQRCSYGYYKIAALQPSMGRQGTRLSGYSEVHSSQKESVDVRLAKVDRRK